MAAGSDTITIGVRNPRKRTLNASPKRRRQDSMKEIGRSSQRADWIAGGSAGPGGSMAPKPTGRPASAAGLLARVERREPRPVVRRQVTARVWYDGYMTALRSVE